MPYNGFLGINSLWTQYQMELEMKVSKYSKDKEFELVKQDDSTYHVNYAYSTCPDGSTQLIYHEWVIKGDLENPFTQNDLTKLKTAMEKQPDLINQRRHSF